jgi:3',5'-cyclic AMP phosphodiesterase CpdA
VQSGSEAIYYARFAKVIWTPGNHELWTPKGDPVQLRGEQRYQYLVELCRNLGVAPRRTRT